MNAVRAGRNASSLIHEEGARTTSVAYLLKCGTALSAIHVVKSRHARGAMIEEGNIRMENISDYHIKIY